MMAIVNLGLGVYRTWGAAIHAILVNRALPGSSAAGDAPRTQQAVIEVRFVHLLSIKTAPNIYARMQLRIQQAYDVSYCFTPLLVFFIELESIRCSCSLDIPLP